MDCIVHRVTKSRTHLSNFHSLTHLQRKDGLMTRKVASRMSVMDHDYMAGWVGGDGSFHKTEESVCILLVSALFCMLTILHLKVLLLKINPSKFRMVFIW